MIISPGFIGDPTRVVTDDTFDNKDVFGASSFALTAK